MTKMKKKKQILLVEGTKNLNNTNRLPELERRRASAGEKEEVGRTTAFRRQSTTATVRRRVSGSYANLPWYRMGMK